MFTALHIRNFRWLLLGTTISNAGMWIQQVTLNWLVYDITGSGTMLGTLNVVTSASSLGLAPMAGVLIDRVSRRMLMLSVNTWYMVITGVLGVVLLLGYNQIWQIFVFAFLGGLAQAIDMALRQVVVFNLVPRERTPNAVALIQTGWSLMRSLGPAIGGFFILWYGAGGNFLIMSGTYALITITITRLNFPARHSDGLRSNPLQNIREGFRFVINEPVIRIFMVMGWALPLFIIPIYVALPPIYAKDVFHGGPEVLGYLMGSVGAGGIAGGIAVAAMMRVERRGLVQIVALLMTALSLIAFAFTTELWVALVLLALSGFFEMIFLTTNQTILQLSIPDGMRGRVTSLVNLNMALMPLGAFMAGAGSDLFGGPKLITIVLCSVAAVVALLFFFSPTVRNYSLNQAIARGSTAPA